MYLLVLSVIVLAILYLQNRNKKNAVVIGLLLIALVMAACANSYHSIENFIGGSPLDYQMGPYSNLEVDNSYLVSSTHPQDYLRTEIQTEEGPRLLKDPNSCGWRKPPCNVPLANQVKVFNPVGKSKDLTQDLASYSFPTVDGKPDSPRHLFMLAKNQCRPECCPSTFSCDTGCVCTTEQQRKLINTRGGNRPHETFPGI